MMTQEEFMDVMAMKRQGLSINALKRIAGALSDTEAARRMQQAKSRLFENLQLTA